MLEDSSSWVTKVVWEQLGLSSYKTDHSQCSVYDYDGSLVSPSIVSSCKKFCSDIIEKCPSSYSKPLRTYLAENIPESEIYDRLSPVHCRVINMNLRILDGQMLYRKSGLNPLNSSRSMSIKGGLGQIAHIYAIHLESQQNGCIVYGTRINSVQIRTKQVVAGKKPAVFVNAKSTTGQGFEANVAVIAVPAGVLQRGSIKFMPELNAESKSAISTIAHQVVSKVVLVFPCAFWDAESPLFHVLQSPARIETPDEYMAHSGLGIQFHAVETGTTTALLVVTFIGNAATHMEKLDDDSITNSVMATLAGIFSERQPLPYPIESIVARWGKDTNSYASSSYLPSRPSAQTRQQLNESYTNRIYFAGDYLDDTDPGTVNGAMKSGMKTAIDIANTMLGNFKSLNLLRKYNEGRCNNDSV
jgi:monoamine oxidase